MMLDRRHSLVLQRSYPATDQTATQGRQELERILPRLRRSCVDTLRLLVSEIITNAVRHGPAETGASIALSIGFEGDRVRVEVEDAGRGCSLPAHPGANGTCGWGLYLVDQLADRWGVLSRGPTTVWFEMDGCVVPEEE